MFYTQNSHNELNCTAENIHLLEIIGNLIIKTNGPLFHIPLIFWDALYKVMLKYCIVILADTHYLTYLEPCLASRLPCAFALADKINTFDL